MLEWDVRCDPASFLRRPGEDGRCDAVSKQRDARARYSARASARSGRALLSFGWREPYQRTMPGTDRCAKERLERTWHGAAGLLGKSELASISGGYGSRDAGRWRQTRSGIG